LLAAGTICAFFAPAKADKIKKGKKKKQYQQSPQSFDGLALDICSIASPY
jgi:hypothetical protein